MSQSFVISQFHGLDQIIFQQDSASAYWVREIPGYLNAKFPGQWICDKVHCHGFPASLT